ncbi:MAG: pantetheine-phosphate adenylyltransferase [Flexilinea sp.]|nr:pantetheine-phosphate adenylyltransferase [Flexilinea sp.]
MMSKRAIFPGSFDPIHNGHIDIARRAADIFDELIVCIYATPQKNLLFSFEERMEMAQRVFEDIPNITVEGYTGLTVDYARKIGAKVMVRGLRVFSDFDYEFRMALANKKLAPDIETVSLITTHQYTFVSSSTVKEVASLGGDVTGMVPTFVRDALMKKYLPA